MANGILLEEIWVFSFYFLLSLEFYWIIDLEGLFGGVLFSYYWMFLGLDLFWELSRLTFLVSILNSF